MLSSLFTRKKRRYPYSACRSLLTPGEAAFYAVLRQAVPAGVTICAKVRLADILICPRKDWKEHGWRVSSKHVDFVLASTATMQPLLLIELDDKSHETRERKERDQFLDEALAEAGVVLCHVKAMREYDLGQLRRMLRQVIG